MSANVGMPADQKLLDDIAKRLIRVHRITSDELTTFFEGHRVPKNEGWSGRVELIALRKAETLSAETLGRLVFALPNADLYGVHCGSWLNKYGHGPDLLRRIAATVIVCQIRAILGVSSGVLTVDRAVARL